MVFSQDFKKVVKECESTAENNEIKSDKRRILEDQAKDLKVSSLPLLTELNSQKYFWSNLSTATQDFIDLGDKNRWLNITNFQSELDEQIATPTLIRFATDEKNPN